MKKIFTLFICLLVFTALKAQNEIMVTNVNDSGEGSLRQAIADAQNNDIIRFDPSINWLKRTVVLKDGLNENNNTGSHGISKNLIIEGNGVAIEGEGYPVINIAATLTFNRVHFKKLESGWAGFVVSGTLNLNSCIFSGCGLFSVRGTLNINGCSFINTGCPIVSIDNYWGSSDRVKLTGNIFYGNDQNVNTDFISGGYNLYDNSFSSATSADIQIEDNPLVPETFHLVDGSVAANVITTLPDDYPTIDFYGNPIIAPAAAGAVQTYFHGYAYEEKVIGFGAVEQIGGTAADDENIVPAGSTVILKALPDNSVPYIKNKFSFWTVDGLRVADTSDVLTLTMNDNKKVEAYFAMEKYTVISSEDTGVGTLREALTLATLTPDSSHITFDNAIANDTLFLQSHLPCIEKDLTIDGNGITLCFNEDYVSEGLSICSGNVSIGRIHFINSSPFRIISNSAKCTLWSCIFSNISGKIYNTGQLYIQACTFIDCGLENDNFIENSSYDNSQIFLTGNLFYSNKGVLIHSYGTGGSMSHQKYAYTQSNGYNVYDEKTKMRNYYTRPYNLYSDFEWVNNDKVIFRFPVSSKTFQLLYNSEALGIITTLPGDYPSVDFYGNPITVPASAGAVQSVASQGYELIYSVKGNGSIAVTSDIQPDEAGIVHPGAMIKLTATPEVSLTDDYVFSHWTIDGNRSSEFSNVLNLLMDKRTEVEAFFVRKVTVTTSSDSGIGSLREALTNAQAYDEILFADSLAGKTITLSSTLPTITKDIIISGNGITISGDNQCRIMTIDAGYGTSSITVSISRIHFYQGNSSIVGGIYNAENLTLSSCIFSENKSFQSGYSGQDPVIIRNNGQLKTYACTFYNNEATTGLIQNYWRNPVAATLIGNIIIQPKYGGISFSSNNASAVNTINYNLYDIDEEGHFTSDKTNLQSEKLSFSPFSFRLLKDSKAANLLKQIPEDYPKLDFYGDSITGTNIAAGAVQSFVNPNAFLVEYEVKGPGIMTIAGTDKDGMVSPGSSVTLTATPNLDYSFAGFSVDGVKYSDTNNPLTIAVNQNTKVEALFGKIYTVTNTNNDGTGSLREGLDNLRGSGYGIIRFADYLANDTIVLSSGLGFSGAFLIIEGNGITISGNNTCQILYLSSNNTIITKVNFINGLADSGGAIGCSYSISMRELLLQQCRFSYNKATNYGGAIYCSYLEMQSCIFDNNQAAMSGGVIVSDKVNIKGCTFYKNHAEDSGGVFYGGYPLGKMTGNVFYDNTETSDSIKNIFYFYGGISGAKPVISSYNVYDAESAQYYFDNESDKKITNIPFNPVTFNPIQDSEFSVIPEVPTGYPFFDYYGNKIKSPILAGAVQDTTMSLCTLAWTKLGDGEIIFGGAEPVYQGNDAAVYNFGDSVTLIASNTDDFAFQYWIVGETKYFENRLDFILDSNISVTVVFYNYIEGMRDLQIDNSADSIVFHWDSQFYGDYFHDSFEDTHSDWKIINKITGGAYYDYQFAKKNVAHTGSSGISSAPTTTNIWNDVAPPDNWCISKPLMIDQSGMLTYWVSGYSQGGLINIGSYGIFISTNSSTESFESVFKESFYYSPVTARSEWNNFVPGVWYKRTVDLSAYAGKTVYIAFRHYDIGDSPDGVPTKNDRFYLSFDDISVTGASNHPTYNICRNGSLIAEDYKKSSFIDIPESNGFYNYCFESVIDGENLVPKDAICSNVLFEKKQKSVENLTNTLVGTNVKLNWGLSSSVVYFSDFKLYDASAIIEDDYTMAVRYKTDQLQKIENAELIKIDYLLSNNTTHNITQETCHLTLCVWKGGSDYDSGTLIYEQDINQFGLGWNSVVLDAPIPVTASQEMWIGIRCHKLVSDELKISLIENQTNGTGITDLIYYNGQWQSVNTLLDQGGALDHTYFHFPLKAVIKQNASVQHLLESPKIYEIYRNGILVGSTPTNIYTENITSSGLYEYCVKMGDEDPALSECISFYFDYVEVTDVTLNKEVLTLEVNESEQLTAIVYPNNANNKNLNWQSTNTTVADVSSDGLVTAKQAGTTTIIVTTEDGGFTASCAIEIFVMKAAKIVNLEPNINLLVHTTVRELATIYRYYRILDVNDNPVKNAQIVYRVDNETYHSQPSDDDGIATIDFPVWGKDVDDENDDYIPIGTDATMSFVGLEHSGIELNVLTNSFNAPYRIFVLPHFADDMHYGLSLGGSGGTGPKLFENKIKAGYTLTLGRLFNEFYEQTGWEVQTDLKGEYLATTTMTGSFPELPFISLEGSATLGGGLKGKRTIKETLPYTNLSYLKILYNMLTGIWNTSELAGEDIHLLLNALNQRLGIANQSIEYAESTTEGFVTGGLGGAISIGGARTFDLGIDLSSTIALSSSSALKYDGAKAEETLVKKHKLSSDIGIEAEATFKGVSHNFGVTVGGSHSGSIDITTERPTYLTALNKASVTTGRGWELEISPSWGTSRGDKDMLVYNQINAISGKLSKEYSDKLTLEKPLFEAANQLQINDPLWGYLTNTTTNAGILFGARFGDHLEAIGNGLSDLDSLSQSNLSTAVKWSSEKEYTINADYSYSSSVSLFGWKSNIGWSGGIFSKGTLPLSESYYHFGVNKTLPIVKYEDLNRFRDITAPLQPLMENLNALANEIYDLDDWIRENYSWYNSYADFTDSFLGKLMYNLWYKKEYTLPANNRERSYSPALRSYKALTESSRTNISDIFIDIPCANQEVFEENTEVRFSHYYPGGEVLGATVAQDTFIVISDIAFLNAYYNKDTLGIAPNGNFKVFATAGADDLAFLDINDTYPVSVYHKSFAEDLWSKIGNTNDTIYTNLLGKFCLGVSVNADKESPAILINKEENADFVNITVTDNMAVFWKETYVLVNGLLTEYERNGSQLTVYLTEEQAKQDVYVTVYAKDLARNEATSTAEFLMSTGIVEIMQDICVLYPNPASSVCNLVIPAELQKKQLSVAVLSTLGQVVYSNSIVTDQTVFDVSSFANGIYFVVVYNHEGIIFHQKLVKKSN